MPDVFSLGFGGHQDVVKVDEDAKQTREALVHKPLEGLGSIAQPKGHVQILPSPEGGNDGGLGNVFFEDRDLVEGGTQIYLAEEFAAAYIICEVG